MGVEDSPQSRAKIKIQWSCTSIPSYKFLVSAETSLSSTRSERVLNYPLVFAYLLTYLLIIIFHLRTAAFNAYCAIWV